VLTIADIDAAAAAGLLAAYGLRLAVVADGDGIPGSYWGAPEAGLIGSTVHARGDTPVHSLLHEAAHLIVLPSGQRDAVHTDATDSEAEEDAVCVLQVLLADALPGVGRDRLLADMDAWGYSFRLGSARAYVENDAATAWTWLQDRNLVDGHQRLLLPPASRPTKPPTPHAPGPATPAALPA